MAIETISRKKEGKRMKALSIKQPWAWLICKGIKDVENRPWYLHMPPLLNYPAITKRIYVHAGKLFEYIGFNWLCMNAHGRLDKVDMEEWARLVIYPTLGAIIGEVDITGCVEHSDSIWFTGPYALTLANPILYNKPIPYKGKPGFFEVEVKYGD